MTELVPAGTRCEGLCQHQRSPSHARPTRSRPCTVGHHSLRTVLRRLVLPQAGHHGLHADGRPVLAIGGEHPRKVLRDAVLRRCGAPRVPIADYHIPAGAGGTTCAIETVELDDDQQSHRCQEIAARARRSGSLRPRPGATLPPAPETSHHVDALAAAQRDRCRTKAAARERVRPCVSVRAVSIVGHGARRTGPAHSPCRHRHRGTRDARPRNALVRSGAHAYVPKGVRPRRSAKRDSSRWKERYVRKGDVPGRRRRAIVMKRGTPAAGRPWRFYAPARSSSADGTTIGPVGGCVKRIGLPNGSRSAQSVP